MGTPSYIGMCISDEWQHPLLLCGGGGDSDGGGDDI